MKNLLIPALFVASGFLSLSTLSAEPGVAETVSGNVQMIKPGETKPIRLRSGGVVPTGATIVTKGGGKAVIPLTSGSAIQISEKTEVEITRVKEHATNPAVKLQLRSGSVGALIREGGKEMDFKIETPHGIAAAHGTFYAVTVDKDKTTAAVREGKIKVNQATKK
ncbi:MAG: hypothetical protein ACI8UO_006325 [Verrucomicrobiales bacterium]|jgi:hypothetical protein